MINQDEIKVKRESARIWLGVGLAVFGCLLIIAGLVIPPTGVIDGSVLTALGEVLGLSGACMGVFSIQRRDNAKIDYMYRYLEQRQHNTENTPDDGTDTEEDIQ